MRYYKIYKMPKKAVDYSKCVIYKIVCNDVNITDCYVGHTTNFTKRKNMHKRSCINQNSKLYNLNVYKFIRDNGGWINFSMIEIEKYPCKDIYEACKRERFWLEQLKATLNKVIPSRTRNEYRNDNVERIREQVKKYSQLHKDEITEYKKEWYQDNRMKILKKVKTEQQIKKDQERQMQHFNCICGGHYGYTHKKRHEKSIKHKNYLEQQQNEQQQNEQQHNEQE